MDENVYQSPTSNTTGISQKDRAVPAFWSFSGRLGRMRAWSYLLGSTLVVMLIAGFAMFLGLSIHPAIGVVVYLGASIFAMVYTFSIYIRRLHDLNQSGWLSLLIFVPLVNFGFLIYALCFKGSEGMNKYGPSTIPNSTGVKVTFWMGIVLIMVIPTLAAISIPAYQDYLMRAQQQTAAPTR